MTADIVDRVRNFVASETDLRVSDHAAVAAALNSAAGAPSYQSVRKGDFVSWACRTGVRAQIEDACGNKALGLVERSLALAVRDFLVSGDQSIDVRYWAQFFPILNAPGVGITRDALSDLMSLALAPRSLAEELWGRPVSHHDIAAIFPPARDTDEQEVLS